MPRAPLGELNPIRVTNTELSSYLRGEIERSHELGQGCKKIAKFPGNRAFDDSVHPQQ